MIKSVIKTHPYASDMANVYELFNSYGFPCFTIFGGAPRDIIASTYYEVNVPVSDFDVRVWATPASYNANITRLLDYLNAQSATIETPDVFQSGGVERVDNSTKPRYVVKIPNKLEMDISFRFVDDAALADLQSALEKVASERAVNSPVGLSAIAAIVNVDGSFTAHYTPNFSLNLIKKELALTVPSQPYILKYVEKIRQKYRMYVDTEEFNIKS